MRILIPILIIVCHFSIGTTNGFAQVYRLNIPNNPLNFKYPDRLDSTQINNFTYRFANQYKVKGYLAVSVDSISWSKEQVNVYFYFGQVYKIGNIKVSNDSNTGTFNQIGLRYTNNLADSLSGSKMADEVLVYLENNGFPFSSIKVDNLLNNDRIEYNLDIRSGPYFVYDTSQIDGDQLLNKKFLAAYTGLKPGMPFNESVFRKAHSKLNQLPFLTSERIPQVAFIYGGKAKPFYYLKKRSSDQINGIVGLAPNTTTGNNQSSVVFTGEFLLKLNNLFKSAKTLTINWRSFKARSQELKTAFNYPYILGKPIGADIGLELTKFDTLYTNIQRLIGLQYYTSGINGLKFFYQVNSTNLNYVDTNLIRSTKQFPAINAVQIRQYGISANFNLLDNRFNPYKGWFIDVMMSAGSKKIQKDNTISEIKFGNGYTLYDSNVLNSNQFLWKCKIEKYLPISSSSTLKFGAMSYQISAPKIYFNELFREGGINSLKGFNEQSIFASNFNMLELEYRFIIGRNSNIRAFWNGAYYEDKSYGRINNVYDFPWGFGIGGNIETGAGILNIIYALGKEKNNGFDLRTGKVHFGISSYF